MTFTTITLTERPAASRRHAAIASESPVHERPLAGGVDV